MHEETYSRLQDAFNRVKSAQSWVIYENDKRILMQGVGDYHEVKKTKVKRYRLKTEIEAMFINERSFNKAVEWIGPKNILHANEDPVHIFLAGDKGLISGSRGRWIVRHKNGRFETFDDKTFRELYEEA